jgi:EAL domain-containing protein (putative c-di-GMP-specific phosphodiesterase class I)
MVMLDTPGVQWRQRQKRSRRVPDLLVIIDRDPDSLRVLRTVADHLGCDRIEAESSDSLNDVLAARRPTIAVLAMDAAEANGLAALRNLAAHHMRPATFLIGACAPRVLASAKRAANRRAFTVIGTSGRPLDPMALERLLTAHLTTAPPIPRGELEQALAADEMTLLYLPKIALRADNVSVQGVEALVRWRHPRRGSLRPVHFLQAVEQHGLMTELTDFVLTEAIRQSGRWCTQGMPLETVVNLTPSLVRDPDFPRRLASLLREHDVPPPQLMLDIAEPSSTEDQDLLLEVFTSLRVLGVGLSLDNFGTGRSSLTELYRMPYSEIKVDQSLLAEGPGDTDAQRIIHAVTDLAHAFGLAVCAEGVETRVMYEFVREAGFDSAQGHFFCAPVDAGQIERFVKEWPRSVSVGTGSCHEPRPTPGESSAAVSRGALRRGAV